MNLEFSKQTFMQNRVVFQGWGPSLWRALESWTWEKNSQDNSSETIRGFFLGRKSLPEVSLQGARQWTLGPAGPPEKAGFVCFSVSFTPGPHPPTQNTWLSRLLLHLLSIISGIVLQSLFYSWLCLAFFLGAWICMRHEDKRALNPKSKSCLMYSFVYFHLSNK